MKMVPTFSYIQTTRFKKSCTSVMLVQSVITVLKSKRRRRNSSREINLSVLQEAGQIVLSSDSVETKG